MHPFILETGCRKAIFQQSEPSCDLENGVKFTKSNQFFFMSQQYRCTSLVKIHSFILEIGCRQAIFKQSEPSCDLKNGVKVTRKLISSFPCHKNIDVQVWSKSIHSFRRQGADKLFSNNLNLSMTLKMRLRSPNLISSFRCLNTIDVQNW